MPSYNELNDEDPRARVTVGDEVLFGAREGVIVRDDEDNEPYQVKLRDGYQTDFLREGQVRRLTKHTKLERQVEEVADAVAKEVLNLQRYPADRPMPEGFRLATEADVAPWLAYAVSALGAFDIAKLDGGMKISGSSCGGHISKRGEDEELDHLLIVKLEGAASEELRAKAASTLDAVLEAACESGRAAPYAVGSRVERGPDWHEWMEDQDGGAGSLGTIGAHNHMDGSRLHQAPPDRRADGWADNCPCVVVEWDHGGAFYYLTYRTGPDSAAAPFGGEMQVRRSHALKHTGPCWAQYF